MQRTALRLRLVVMFAVACLLMVALSAGIFLSSRIAEGASLAYTETNVIAKSADGNVSLYAFDASAANKMGAEVSPAAGPHGGLPNKSLLTDGTIASTSSVMLADSEGKGVIGWVVIDAGQKYPVNKVLVDLVHDWGAGDLVIQLSTDAAFTSPVTIYNNDTDGSLGLGSAFTADADISADDTLMNIVSAGRTFEFAPVVARYIRVTGNTVGNGVSQGYTALGEVQMFALNYSDAPQTHSEVTPAVFSTPGGVYAQAPKLELSSMTDGAKIYYTTDGSCPTRESAVYSEPIDISLLDNACVIRAVCEVNGVLGIPVQNTFAYEAKAITENVALGKTVYARDMSMQNEVYFSLDSSKITDGIFDVTDIYLQSDADNITPETRTYGWVIVDFGEVCNIASVQVSFWHDNHFTNAVIQLSETADFANPTTVYSNDAEIAPVTVDEPEWSNTDANGKTLELSEPVAARYIRVTGRRQEDASKYMMINEIRADKIVEPEVGPTNVALGKTVYARDMDMQNEVYFSKDSSMITDGSFDTTDIYLQTAAGESAARTYGWVIVDFGAVYKIGSVQVSFWHDNHFTSAVIQLSETADFANPTTVYSNDASIAPVTVDETEWSNTDANGKTLELSEPVAARYIRVTGRRREDGNAYTMINEIRADKVTDQTINPAPELQDYVVSAADNYGLPLQNVSVANGSYFKEVAALLPGTVQLTSSQGKMSEAAGSWECAEFSKDETDGETEEGVYTFVFAYEAAGSVPADLYSVVSVSVTVEKPADIADLQAKVAEAEQIQAAKYTVSTFAALQEKIGDAEELLSARTKTQAQADAALAALESAKAALVERGDVAELNTLYESLSGKQEAEYTVSSWAAFSKAYAAAGALLKDADDVSQAQVEEAVTALEAAALVKRGDTSALSAKYDELKGKYGTDTQSSKYTKQSWSDYLQAMEEAAAAVADSSDVSQADADALVAALGTAESSLVEKADVTQILARAAQYRADKAKYTAASWAEFEVVLLETEEALGGDDVPMAEYEEVAAAFEAAEAKLVLIGDASELNALIDTEVGEEAEYTAASWLAYETALADARAAANGQNSQATIDAAKDALNAAIQGLVKKGDKTQLTALVAEANKEQNIGQELAAAINAAQEVLNDADASEEDVNAAYAALNEALENNEGGSSGDAGGCGGFAGVSVLAAAIICLAAAVVLLAKKKAGR